MQSASSAFVVKSMPYMGVKSGQNSGSFVESSFVLGSFLVRSSFVLENSPHIWTGGFREPPQVTVTLNVTVTWFIKPKADDAKSLVRSTFLSADRCLQSIVQPGKMNHW